MDFPSVGSNRALPLALDWRSTSALGAAKERMSPYSAVAFVALGLPTLGLSRRRAAVAAQAVATVATAIGVVSIVGPLWNAAEIVTDRLGAETASRAKSAFLANMGHEIRTR